MIIANGRYYRTLDQDIYVNGKKVMEAYCNGHLVYPERGDAPYLLKLIGHIDTIISHDHTGENPSGTASGCENYTYHDGDSYRAKGCFSLVLRSHSSIYYDDEVTMFPSAKWPLDLRYSSSESEGDIIRPGNDWIVSSNMLPNSGGGVHPLLGSDEMATHIIKRNYNTLFDVDAELLIYLDVSAPRICPFSAESINFGLGYPYLNAEGTPLKPYLNEVPEDVNGFRRLYITKRDIYSGLSWTIQAPSGRHFDIRLIPLADNSRVLFSHVKIDIPWSRTGGYSATYVIRGTRNGVYTETETTEILDFRVLNIPITDKIYLGSEQAAPEEYLHPRMEDLTPFI